MYSGVAEPASPASTSAASPGARWSSAKSRTTMVRIVGSASARRRKTYRRPLPVGRTARDSLESLLLLEPGLVERRVKAERAHEPVVDLLVVERREVELEHPDEWASLHHLLLELLVQRRALLR